MKSKKFLSWLLVLCMVFSLVPALGITAFAADYPESCPCTKGHTPNEPHYYLYKMDEEKLYFHIYGWASSDDEWAVGDEQTKSAEMVVGTCYYGSDWSICYTSAPAHEHDGITFTQPWDGGADHNKLPTEPGNYYLTQDITIRSQQKITGDVALCLNGHVINCDKVGRNNPNGAILIQRNANFTLYDCSKEQHHFKENANKHLWEQDAEGDKTVTGGYFYSGQGDSTPITVNGGTFTMYGGNFVGSPSYGIWVLSGSFTMNGGAILGSAASGVQVVNGTFKMTDGLIAYNHAIGSSNGYGGGVFIPASNNTPDCFVMSGGTISNNIADQYGGGVCIRNGSSSATMTGGEISGNTAQIGGGLYFDSNGSPFTMTGGKISGNLATLNSGGGGVYLYCKTFTVGGTAQIIDNKKGSGNDKVDNNVHLPNNNKFITISTETAPVTSGTDVMSVGVSANDGTITLYRPMKITDSGSDALKACIHSDNDAYVVGLSSTNPPYLQLEMIPSSVTVTPVATLPTFTYGTAKEAAKVADLTSSGISGTVTFTPAWYSAASGGNQLTTNTPTASVNGTTLNVSVGNSVPAGEYYLEVTGSNGSVSATSTTRIKITVGKASDNAFTAQPTITGWNYGSTPNTASGAVAKYGTATYKYYSDADCTKEITPNSNTAPGTYYVKAFVEGSANYNAASSNAVSFTISKATDNAFTAQPSITGWSYGSTPNTASGAVAKYGTASYKYYSDADCTKEITPSSSTAPGTYYVKAFVADSDNYNAASSNAVSFTIGKATATKDLLTYTAPSNLTYDNTAKTATVTAKSGVSGVGTISVIYKKNGVVVDNPTDAGAYQVYASMAEGSNYGTLAETLVGNFTIAKAEYAGTKTASGNLKAKNGSTVEVTLPDLPDGASYGTVTNSNSALFTVGAISNGKVTVTSAKDWNKDTEKGNKTFTVLVTGAANYNNYYITVTIAPMFKTKLTVSDVSMDKESYTYGDTVGYTGTVSMKNGEDAVTGITPEYTYYQTSDKGTTWTKLNAAPTNAGDYKLVVSIPESNENYEGSQEVPFSIAKKSVTAPSANTNAFVYTGSEQTYFTIADNADYKLAEDSDAASQTNAGTYNIKLELKDTANCQWAEGAVTEFTFVINPRVTIKDQTGAVVCNGVDTDLNGSYKLPEGTTLKPGTYQVVTELGSKTITSVLVVEDGVKPTTTVTIPDKNVSSEVEIKTTAGTPNITVTGLNTLADTYEPGANESISVTMTVEAKPADASSDAQAAIKAVNDSQTTKVSKFDFVDMSIIKESFTNGISNGTDPVHNANAVLEIIVPFTTSGRKDITVFRYHNDGTNPAKTKAFDKLDERPTGSFADGTYFVGNGFLVVYARYFSEYAIGYNTVSTGGGSVSNSIIVPASVEHGKLSADKKSASFGEKVTITVTPDKGYTLETLTVKDAKGNAVEVTKLNKTTYTFKMPSSKVTVEATFMEDNSMLNFFVDVKATDYYYDAVLWAAENGITSGTDATHFSPEMGTTRAQVVTFLWRAAGCPDAEGESFADVVSGSYYEKAVAWGIENGVVKGTSPTTFSPDMVCTRGQIAAFLARFAGVKDADTASAFDDVKSTDYFAAAVKWAKDNKVTEGTTATTYSPDADCTRAQIVTFLYRYMSK